VASFRDEQVRLLTASGWNACDSIRDGLVKANLPAPRARYLEDAFSAEQWERAHAATIALRDHFSGVRFADQACVGILLVPDPSKLDTRGAVDPAIRRCQTDVADFIDPRLPAGRVAVEPGEDWTLVATVTGSAGLCMGSYNDVRDDEGAETYTVAGVDTRELMVRQIWGARVLQSGGEPPDSNAHKRWTFTLFPGEHLTDGCAPSGTVLHGQVRLRLGRPDRGIAPARVCPALAIPLK
jgi:hypothetical protein